MKEFMSIARALSDENRVRILMFLRHGDMCVCQIIEMLGLAPSTVSKHLSILKQANLIDSHKKGRWVHYHLASLPSPVVAAGLQWIQESLAEDRKILEDDLVLVRVKEACLVDLCVHYTNSAREAA